jgi:SAM-dependent methyltransferase
MLDITLATEFIPGTNVRGEVTGANWSFLLPSLELGNVLYVGVPASATMVTIARRAQSVMVICANTTQSQRLRDICDVYELTTVQWLSADRVDLPALANCSMDIVVVADGCDVVQDPANVKELRRLLKPGGLLYAETNGLADRLQIASVVRALSQHFGLVQGFWLTPLRGEMHTAVPVDDSATIAYFVRYGLYSSSVDLRVMKRTVQSSLGRRVYRRSSTQVAIAQQSMNSAPASPDERSGTRLRRRSRLSRPLDLLVNSTQRALDGIERLLTHRTISQWTQRYAFLAGPAADHRNAQPPQYLQTIAQQAGLDIGRYRWGLSARGEYSSRKVLFFLYDSENDKPDYIVKMTRDTTLNPRLENECRALKILREKGVGSRETLPEVAFFGHHSGLAIVGETIVDGRPFEQQTGATADCPYVIAAIDWLLNLSGATLNKTEATPFQVAEGLSILYRRFAEIYQLPAQYLDFLEGQIASISQIQAPFPLVFQHGDPGTWNIMVLPTGCVAFLDWEAAEQTGMPLWDLFYFMRAYGVLASRRLGIRDMTKGFAEQFVHETPIATLLIESTRRACDRLGLPMVLVEPLFYTCWMHRALKEATRLEANKLDQGHYVSLLRLCIEQRDTSALQRLFSL